jgi:hypothetical protein
VAHFWPFLNLNLACCAHESLATLHFTAVLAFGLRMRECVGRVLPETRFVALKKERKKERAATFSLARK